MALSQTKEKNTPEVSGLFQKTDAFFDRHMHLFQWILPLLGCIMALMMYQGKISIGNDDALYIVSAYKMGLNPFDNPYTASAPLYIIILSFVTKIFGMQLLPMKILNMLFYIGSVFFFFKALKNKIPSTILVFSLLMYVFNWVLLEYASFTYTEALYLFLISLLFLTFSRLLDLDNEESVASKKKLIYVGCLGLLSVLIFTTRNIAAVVPLCMFVLFVLAKKYKDGLFYLAFFAAFYLLRQGIFEIIWPGLNQFNAQGSAMLLKDSYNPAMGKEDLGGMIDRFLINARFYTVRYLESLGLMKAYTNLKPENYGFIALLFSSLQVFAFFMAIRNKDRMMQLLSGIMLVLLGATYFALQINWAQHRFIAVYTIMISASSFYVLYKLSADKKRNFLQIFVLLFMAAFLFSGIISTTKRANENIPIAIANLKGDKYKGYSMDWVNFLKASEWCADNLPKDAYVVSRKEPMSYIYGKGFNFYPIYKIPLDSVSGEPMRDADALISYFRNAPYRVNMNELIKVKVEYFILAQLRVDVKRKISGQFINTIHNCLYPIEEKYPGCLELVHTEGTDEITQVVRIDYDFIDRMRAEREGGI